jgi:energy-coupling factor transporter ATP-binding protein EcfA2
MFRRNFAIPPNWFEVARERDFPNLPCHRPQKSRVCEIVKRESAPWAISRIVVDGLFGLYSYEIPAARQHADFSKLLILYGDNGSGKTTILSLLFHLLSPESRRGHKTFVAQTMFKRIAVHFANGGDVTATRAKDRQKGTFDMSVNLNGKSTSCTFQVDESDAVPASTITPEQVEVYRRLAELDIYFYFLSDNRKIQLSAPIAGQSGRSYATAEHEEELFSRTFYEEKRRHPNAVDILITSTVDRTTEWIRQQVTQASNVGAENANNIYIDIVRRIAKLPEKGRLETSLSPRSITRSLKMAAKRNERYSQFELTAPLDVGPLVTALANAHPRNRPVILSVLKPFVEGTIARLDALGKIQLLLETLLRNLNSFLVDKEIAFTLKKGFRIVSANQMNLDPTDLSSGEKHLLLILCNSIMSTGNRSVFIIDEPELSLNVKWQRKLVPVLLELSQAASVQYIFATHSVELLANSFDNVVKLRTLKDGKRIGRRNQASNA